MKTRVRTTYAPCPPSGATLDMLYELGGPDACHAPHRAAQ